jgi:hypothetical protein
MTTINIQSNEMYNFVQNSLLLCSKTLLCAIHNRWCIHLNTQINSRALTRLKFPTALRGQKRFSLCVSLALSPTRGSLENQPEKRRWERNFSRSQIMKEKYLKKHISIKGIHTHSHLRFNREKKQHQRRKKFVTRTERVKSNQKIHFSSYFRQHPWLYSAFKAVYDQTFERLRPLRLSPRRMFNLILIWITV